MKYSCVTEVFAKVNGWMGRFWGDAAFWQRTYVNEAAWDDIFFDAEPCPTDGEIQTRSIVDTSQMPRLQETY